jgi:Protein of unknown function (DUF3710)
LFRRRRDAGEGRHRPGSRPAPEPDDEFEDGEDPGEPAGSGDDDPADDSYRGRHGPAGLGNQGADQVAGSGPWDSASPYPRAERVDLGSLLIPVIPGQQIHLELNEEQNQVVAVSVTLDGGRLQVRVLAAPKTAGLWDEERVNLAGLIRKLGGESREADGPFGPELQAREPAEPGSGETTPQPARYLGVDGPRWLLCAKISGPAARLPDLAEQLEQVIADIVVVRGDHPAPPRDLLEIQLPAEMRAAIAEQVAQAEAEQRQQYPNPFDRGPEITETR